MKPSSDIDLFTTTLPVPVFMSLILPEAIALSLRRWMGLSSAPYLAASHCERRYLELLCIAVLGYGCAGGDVRVAKDLVAASATPMVLGILAEGESYGYAILRRINELSGGELDWTEGLLYPLLHRLERLGYVEATWQSVTGERRRKYYRITDDGLAELAEQRRQWDTVVDALKEIWLDPGDSNPRGQNVKRMTAIALGGLA
jgi:DNA-binding PadR family transcriptional regulator